MSCKIKRQWQTALGFTHFILECFIISFYTTTIKQLAKNKKTYNLPINKNSTNKLNLCLKLQLIK